MSIPIIRTQLQSKGMKNGLAIALLITLSLMLVVSAIYVGLRKDGNPNPTVPPTQLYSYSVTNTFPHDSDAFTEGLVFDGGWLYEGTGLYGRSDLRRVNLTTGAILASTPLSGAYFGEGIAVVNDSIIQLTWRTNVGFVYDKDSLAQKGDFSYAGEGWGLTYDGTKLVMSNGSDTLTFLDPATYEATGYIKVRDGNDSISALNELEYVNGDVYANIFGQRKIVIINPQTGQAKGWVDLSDLEGAATSDPEAVLNGIAYDANGGRLFVTGKYWPHIYEITLSPASS